jgi:hypothetical protein
MFSFPLIGVVACSLADFKSYNEWNEIFAPAIMEKVGWNGHHESPPKFKACMEGESH